jgi:glucose-1-phosphate thymidylyltransferase
LGCWGVKKIVTNLKGLMPVFREAASPGGLAALAPIGNRPCAAHAIDAMISLGVRDVAIAGTSRVLEALEPVVADGVWPMLRVTWIERTERPGVLGALLDAEEFIDGAPTLVHPATSMVRSGLRRARLRFDADAPDALVVAGVPSGATPEPPSLEELRIARLLAAVAGRAVVDTGVHLLGANFFDCVRPHRDLSGVLASLADGDDGRLAVETSGRWWVFDGTLDGMLEGNRQVLEDLEPLIDVESLTDARVQGRVHIHPTAQIESSTIRGPVVIGAHAQIRHAYIGPYTSIGDAVEVEGAELENSIVLPRARIKFVGRRIEASVVGADAHIRRDFSLPQAVRLWVGDGAEIGLA